MPQRQKLIDGFRLFRGEQYLGSPLLKELVRDGASPDFFIINCIDPRSGADIVFGAPPGQQFTKPLMATIVPPYHPDNLTELQAALSYAIDVKKIKHLIILGHSQCAGCGALVNGTDDPFIARWVIKGEPALHKAALKAGFADPTCLQRETERQIVAFSLQNISQYPVVARALAEGRLTVNGWLFGMEDCSLHEYDPETDSFQRINEAEYRPDRPSAVLTPTL